MKSNEDELVRLFAERLYFNDASLKELEKATRGQSCQKTWMEQKKDRITISNFHGVYCRVKKIMRMRGESVKTKITPLLKRLLDQADLSEIPAIKWGHTHEKAASETFLRLKAKITKIQNCMCVDCFCQRLTLF